METEGPNTNEGNEQGPRKPKVVQLGDWIGPRDELVPFGHRPRSRRGEAPLTSSDRAGSESDQAAGTEPDLPPPATPELPPSADDFWGERAGAIHDALQAPTDDWPAAGAGLTGRVRTSPRVPANRLRRDRLVVAVACLTLVAAIGLAAAFNPLGAGTSRRGSGGGAKIPLASVLSNGVSRALTLGLSRIGPTNAKAHLRSTRLRRHASRTHPISEPVHHTTPPRSSSAVNAHPVTSEYTARVAPAAPAPEETFSHRAASAGSPETRPTSSSPPVSATGASGALGPIQSPNG